MSHEEHANLDSQFKGFRKHFNGETIRGRANVAKATYLGLGIYYLYYRSKKKKEAKREAEKAALNASVSNDSSVANGIPHEKENLAETGTT